MSKRKIKINISPIIIFATIILFIAIISGIGIKSHNDKNSNNSNNFNTTNSSATSQTQNQQSGEQNTGSNTNTEPQLSEVEKINQQRKTCSKITKERNIPVLMYHFFYDKNSPETKTDANFMEIHDFEEQIKYLAENNYYVPSWEELEDFVNGKIGLPEKSIIITVDDGDSSFFKLAVPVLEKYNFYATSFLISSWYPNGIDSVKSPVVDFQSHSHNMHRAGSDGKGAILTLSYDSACEDLQTSKNTIGTDCRIFCYPFGHFNDSAKKVLKDCGFKMAFTTQGGYVTPGMNLYELPRVRMSKGISLNAFIAKIK